MKNYVFASSLFLRTPALTTKRSQKADSLKFLLTNEEFRKAIFLASASFFEELAKINFDYVRLSQKQKLTLLKYVNRATYRSTPFGLFASVCSVPWTEYESRPVVSEPGQRITLDYALVYRLWQRYLKPGTDEETQYRANPTLVETEMDYRYSFNSVDPTGKLLFSLVSVEKNCLLQQLLTYGNTKRTFGELATYLKEKNGSSVEKATEFLSELVEQQLLVRCDCPTPVGSDPALALASRVEKLSKRPPFQLERISNELQRAAEPELKRLDDLINTEAFFRKTLADAGSVNTFYTIGYWKKIEGGLAGKWQKTVKEGVSCLLRLASTYSNPDLENFKRDFLEKYDSEAVPLLEVLDEQFGIGYGNHNAIAGFDSLSEPLISQQGRQSAKPGSSEKERLARSAWKWGRRLIEQNSSVLTITDQWLDSFGMEETAAGLPPSITVMFRLMGDNAYIETAGGCSALSMIGRFTYDAGLFQLAKEVAGHEKNWNKDVLFAEIVHTTHLHTANIERRPHLRDVEIPVLDGSTMEERDQVPLCDLLVAVKDRSICLYSKSRNKVVVPRLSSAFNFTKSAFPVYRFLCDLQHQGLKTNLSFSLPGILPGLKYYPRVQYKSCCLQLAEWHVEAADFRDFLEATQERRKPAFQKLHEKLNLPSCFALVTGDNFLFFDLTDPTALELLAQELKGKQKIILREHPFSGEPSVVDSKGQPYQAEFVAPLLLCEQTYAGRAPTARELMQQETKADTNDWVYSKAFCHPLTADFILTNHLIPLARTFKQRAIVSDWFWVRYNDPEYHIRFRMRAAAKDKEAVSAGVATCLQDLQAKKLINKFQFDRYIREAERYTPDLIEPVEAVFTASSEATADFLERKGNAQFGENEVMEEAVKSSLAIFDAFGFHTADKALMAKQQFDAFYKEFRSPKTLKSVAEQFYKKNRKEWERLTYGPSHDRITYPVQQLLLQGKKGNTPPSVVKQLSLDVVHMHLNRLFAQEPRYFEMITYFLLYRKSFESLHRTGERVSSVSI